MLKKFKKDVLRLEGGFVRKAINIGLWILFVYRISNWFFKHKMLVISKVFWMINRLFFTVDIDPGADLAGGVKLVHPMSIVIGREVISEGELTIYQSVTLGGSNNKTKKYKGRELHQPYILSNVVIFTSAIVLGPLVLGENSIVSAGSILTKDLPPNSLVRGVNNFVQI